MNRLQWAFAFITLTIIKSDLGIASNATNRNACRFEKILKPAQYTIRNLTAYSKDESSISLRFLLSFPPHENFKWYAVICWHANLTNTDDNQLKNCKRLFSFLLVCELWKNFHCVKLEQLSKNRKYNITVEALAFDWDVYDVDSTSIEVETSQERPNALENLTAEWDNYYNLTLTWSHPTMANGPLTKFVVTIELKDGTCCNNKSFAISEEKYNSTYSYVIPLDKCYASEIRISPAAFNVYEGQPPLNPLFVWSPPKTPSLSKDPSIETVTSSTITINIPTPKDLGNNRRRNNNVPLLTMGITTSYQYRNKDKVKEPRDSLDGEYITPVFIDELNSALANHKKCSTIIEFSKPVKIIKFEKYVKDSIENGELERQHQLFPQGQTKPWTYGLIPQNKYKNRYGNVIAYNHSRVKLAKINNDPFSDYINASYIEGHNSEKAYIATENPKNATVNDFWRMIWQENVKYIVMLASVTGKGEVNIPVSERFFVNRLVMQIPNIHLVLEFPLNSRLAAVGCGARIAIFAKETVQYWPNINQSLEFGDITVKQVSSQVFADYEHKKFKIWFKNVTRKVDQLHFTSWPCFGVLLYPQSLVVFLRKILKLPQRTSPIVVHCRTGVGRTGILILCDLCLRVAGRKGTVDVVKYLHKIREQRANLVANIEQYKLVHLVLLECLLAPQTSISCDEETESSILSFLKSERVAQQMQYLYETAWQDQVMRPPLEITPSPQWSTKNRFQDIVPGGYGRVFLSCDTVADKNSEYINAVEVDGFRSKPRFIVTQQPLRNTIPDFWRMVYEKNVTTIVSLNEIYFGNKTSCKFWPSGERSEIQPLQFLTLKFYSKFDTDHYNVISVLMDNNKDEKNTKRIVNLILLKGWPAEKLLPYDEKSLLMLWEATEKMSRGSTPVVVTCYDGAKACGLFVALSFVIDKINLEHECDVCLAVRTVRRNRKQFVTEIDQYSFLYRTVISYLSCFDMYANFRILKDSNN